MARIEKGEAGYVATINFNQPGGAAVAETMANEPGIIGISIITMPAEQAPPSVEEPTPGEPTEEP